jgi:DNA-directed RNA polymerase subunit RPC12/RpoP
MSYICTRCSSPNYSVKQRVMGPLGTGGLDRKLISDGDRTLIRCDDCLHTSWVDGWIDRGPAWIEQMREEAISRRPMRP